jgi:hypothetical protein
MMRSVSATMTTNYQPVSIGHYVEETRPCRRRTPTRYRPVVPGFAAPFSAHPIPSKPQHRNRQRSKTKTAPRTISQRNTQTRQPLDDTDPRRAPQPDPQPWTAEAHPETTRPPPHPGHASRPGNRNPGQATQNHVPTPTAPAKKPAISELGLRLS